MDKRTDRRIDVDKKEQVAVDMFNHTVCACGARDLTRARYIPYTLIAILPSVQLMQYLQQHLTDAMRKVLAAIFKSLSISRIFPRE